jgi:hypothetical protein
MRVLRGVGGALGPAGGAQVAGQVPRRSVDVVKNEQTGIATVCLNRPDKKNAISGKAKLFSDVAFLVVALSLSREFAILDLLDNHHK